MRLNRECWQFCSWNRQDRTFHIIRWTTILNHVTTINKLNCFSFAIPKKSADLIWTGFFFSFLISWAPPITLIHKRNSIIHLLWGSFCPLFRSQSGVCMKCRILVKDVKVENVQNRLSSSISWMDGFGRQCRIPPIKYMTLWQGLVKCLLLGFKYF